MNLASLRQQRHPKPRQHPQPPNLNRQYEAAIQPLVLQKLGDPFGIALVALAALQGFQLGRLRQQYPLRGPPIDSRPGSRRCRWTPWRSRRRVTVASRPAARSGRLERCERSCDTSCRWFHRELKRRPRQCLHEYRSRRSGARDSLHFDDPWYLLAPHSEGCFDKTNFPSRAEHLDYRRPPHSSILKTHPSQIHQRTRVVANCVRLMSLAALPSSPPQDPFSSPSVPFSVP